MFVVVFLLLGSATGLWITGQGAGLVTLFTSNSTAIYQASDNGFNRESYPNIKWEALLPENEKALLGKSPNELTASNKIPLHEQVFQSIQRTFDSNYQQALVSTNTVSALNNTPVSLNGFIVPVEANAEREITAFFVVPYFGACIHYPPPPPNQIVLVRLTEPYQLADIYTPVVITGRLLITNATKKLSYVDGAADIDSGYTMEATDIELYRH